MINLFCDTLDFPPRLLVWAGQGGAKVFVHAAVVEGMHDIQIAMKLRGIVQRLSYMIVHFLIKAPNFADMLTYLFRSNLDIEPSKTDANTRWRRPPS